MGEGDLLFVCLLGFLLVFALYFPCNVSVNDPLKMRMFVSRVLSLNFEINSSSTWFYFNYSHLWDNTPYMVILVILLWKYTSEYSQATGDFILHFL